LKQIFIILFSILLLLQSGQYVISQQVNSRPKVGLALSGGGSLGMAHIGVIKVMEEAGLRPDYITGVSMGSIVGGFYAIGYSADSLHKIVKGMNWDLILSNNIEENKVIFSEKEHFNNSIISLPLTSRKVTLPSGLINGQQIENLFSYYAWPAAGRNDFSKLPIPFMCLAVDILTGKKVGLQGGYLPDAMRASSAVPTLFTPIKIDSALLVDGGVLRNYAADEVRKMGADIVIGSYTGFQIKSEEELKTIPGIIKQLVFQRSHEDYQEQKKITDLLIEPKVRDFSSTVFYNVDTLVERGYKAASPYREYFRKLADSLNIIGPQKPLENILENQIWSFDKIEVTGNVLYADYQIRGVLGIAPGDKVDKKTIRDKIDLLYGKTWFEKVKYRITSRNDSLILFIDCIERPKSTLYGGVHYDNTIKAGIIFRLTSKDLISKKSFFDFDSFIGQFYRFNFTMFQYIDRNERFGLSADLHADNTSLPMLRIRDETGSAIYRHNYARLKISKYLGLNHLMNLTLSLQNTSLSPEYIASDYIKRISYKYLEGGYSYRINTIDTKHFPNRGLLFQISVNTSKLLSGKIRTDSYNKTYTSEFPGDFLFNRSYSVAGDMRRYFSTGRRLTFSAGWNVMFTHTKDSITSPHNYYFAGGEESAFSGSIPFTGFHTGEIAVDRFAGLRFDADYEFYKDLHLSLITNVAIAREPGISDDLSILGGYGFGLGYMSIIGPLKIGFMHGLSSSERYYSAIKGYISIGFNF
jgi:NTE family protein